MLLHYLGKQKAKNCVVSLKRCIVLPTDTKQRHFHNYHSVTALPFILTRIGRMHQTRARNGVQHATVCYHTLIVYQVCRVVGRCVKSGCCSLTGL